MSSTQTIPCHIQGVEFDLLSPADIKAISVKRIQFPTSFDTLLNPIPGGLYDLALGAFGDYVCATCKLSSFDCPGHFGHIELPVQVYHVTYLPQVLWLLRARCQYCNYLRISRSEVNRYCCKFRLIDNGLLAKAKELDTITIESGAGDEAIESGAEEEQNEQSLIKRRAQFVKRALREAADWKEQQWSFDPDSAIMQARGVLLKDFFKTIAGARKCKNCKGTSSRYRHDSFVKIFDQGLSQKQHSDMKSIGMKARNALDMLKQRKHKPEKGIQRENLDIDESLADVLDEDGPRGQKYVTAAEAHAAIELLFMAESDLFNLVFNSGLALNRGEKALSADMFFIRYLQVTPNKYRPELKTSSGDVAEDQQNNLYKTILKQSEILVQIQRDLLGLPKENVTVGPQRKRDIIDLQENWVRLQQSVNSLIDSDRNPGRGSINEEGVKQKLEKKDGLFRKHMMGKRVNFAARSVISPDPNIETSEIGVPPVFAKKLTFPEPVTKHNRHALHQMVVNGPDKWPGAAAIENEQGQVQVLRFKTKSQREALANMLTASSNPTIKGGGNKKVHRHLNNGDVVLMNRQPTLHKPSIMGHRTRVLPGEKTIRMHYANCNTYNADFDGDEMNMHFPQNEIARAEAMMIANTDSQYLSSTAGKPLRGLIQDHISMGVWLTNRDTFFTRSEYQQLLFDCLRPDQYDISNGTRIKMLAPAIFKPKQLWTGKQVVSTVLLNLMPQGYAGITLKSKSSTAADHWGPASEENVVIFQDGEMLCGILDKSQLGPSANGLVHSVYESYTPLLAGRLLSVLGRLLTQFLRMRAFSCGIEDLVLTPKGDHDRRQTLVHADKLGLEVATKYVTLEDRKPAADDPELLNRLEDVLRDDDKQTRFDTVINARSKDLSSDITKSCLPVGLIKPFPRNQMQLMTNSGAKGSQVNANLISCNLGQQVLEGRRVPIMVSGKTLPCFTPFNTNIRAGGYICDRFLTGIRTQEYYFHAMAGREGLIDTAVKTSRSGYLQRCLIKGMEGLSVNYDTTVRDADGTMVQWLYGEDGLDVTRAKGLNDFNFLVNNARSHHKNLNLDGRLEKVLLKPVVKYQKKVMKKLSRGKDPEDLDPLLSMYNPGSYAYSTSEKFAMSLKKYLKDDKDQAFKSDDNQKRLPRDIVSKDDFETLVNFKYLRSVIEPGEPVGIVAAQSVGEPSTQMTLNTFHLAGHSAKNVTLGIPRLREIVMTASKNIKTPLMTLHLVPELPKEDGNTFAKAISRLSLAEVTDCVRLEERLGEGKVHTAATIFNIDIKFFPADEYFEEYAVSKADVARTIEQKFLPLLRAQIKKEHTNLEKRSAAKASSAGDAMPAIGESHRVLSDAPRVVQQASKKKKDNDDDEEVDDDDVTNEKYKRNQGEAATYDAPDEEEAQIAADGQRDAFPENEMEGDEDERGSPEPEAPVSGEIERRQNRIFQQNKEVTAFRFDDKDGEWASIQLEYSATAPKILMLPLVERVLHHAVVQAVDGIQGCVLDSDEYLAPGADEAVKVPAVLTTGVNLRAMHEHQHIIDPTRIFTNDVAAMLEVYGVEAARNIIIREINSVFQGHGISVDMRHLMLIADSMTRGGDYVAFNRQGIKDSASPLAKMSFETTVAFLRDTVLEKGIDSLDNPSARLVVGTMGRVGTGGLDILLPVNV